MKGVQYYELFRRIALKNYAFSNFFNFIYLLFFVVFVTSFMMYLILILSSMKYCFLS